MKGDMLPGLETGAPASLHFVNEFSHAAVRKPHPP
jgi:hypothetical protein